MTPPTNRSLPRAWFSAALLALGLAAVTPAQATLPGKAIGNFRGLSPTDVPTVPTLRERVVEAGLDAIGTPYAWGGDDPDGFDCSGLVTFVFKQVAGLEMPRRARDQRGRGKAVGTGQLQPGDLVFFGVKRRNVTSHVGIYIGDNQFVHAPTRGARVRVDRLNIPYWSKRFNGARRYLAPAGQPVPEALHMASATRR